MASVAPLCAGRSPHPARRSAILLRASGTGNASAGPIAACYTSRVRAMPRLTRRSFVSASDPSPLVVQELHRRRTWRQDTRSPRDWTVRVSTECREEIARAVERMRLGADGPTEGLRPDQFALPACTRLMRDVRAKLVDGPGLAVVDRVPVRQYSKGEGRAIGWLLASLLDRVVSQKW